MIERFNLYDLYGYLLPGVALLGLLWLPYTVGPKIWPPLELASALLVLVVGYTLGHVLHELSRWYLPSYVVRRGVRSYPSDDVLDAEDKTFSASDKERIRKKICEWYGIDITVRENRQTAFRMCRNELLQKGRVSYAEQFQGMYGLMRGLAANSFLASAYFLGWAVGAGFDRGIRKAFVMTLGAIIAVAFVAICLKVESLSDAQKTNSAWAGSRYWVLVGLVFIVGVALAMEIRLKMPADIAAAFLMLSLVAIGIGLICVGTYRSFSLTFARTVYTDFLVLKKTADEITGGKTV